MVSKQEALINAAAAKVRERFREEGTVPTRVPSTAHEAPTGRVDQFVLPDEERGRMPFTKEKFLIRENPNKVTWERETRKFLRKLSPDHEHRIAAVHIFEWATGLSLAALVAAEKDGDVSQTRWRGDLRHINWALRNYFGKPYATYIMGRKIPKAYKVPKGWYVYKHKPHTLTLYADWAEGVKL